MKTSPFGPGFESSRHMDSCGRSGFTSAHSYRIRRHVRQARRAFGWGRRAATNAPIIKRSRIYFHEDKQERQKEKNQAREGADGPGSEPGERSRARQRRRFLDRRDHERIEPATP